MKRVLALGYIPKSKGGLQASGLATGIFDLHNAVNELEANVKVYIAATDIFEETKIIDSTTVIGWSKGRIARHAIKRFYRLPFFVMSALSLVKYKPISSFSRELTKLLFLDLAIEKVQPDCIHLHGCFYAEYKKMIWHRNIPVFLRIHGINGFNETIKNNTVFRELEKDITSLPFKKVTFVTSSICDEWKIKIGEFKCPMVPILNGYNSNVFYPSKVDVEKQYDLITIAGLSDNKGQIRVMEAIKECQRKGRYYSYVIVGDNRNEYGEMLKKYAEDNKLDVTFTGYLSQKEANKYLWASKYFIQPSVTEGFGKVFIESVGAGIPVILPKNLPIVMDSNILNDINSLLLEDASTNSIYRLLMSLGEYHYEKNELACTVKQLSWHNIAEEYVKLYEE